MKNRILNEKIITKVARDTGIDLEDTKVIIKSYFDNLRSELIEGVTVITPLGDIFVSKRKLNTNISDKTSTHKLNYKINKDFKKFLEDKS